MNILGINAYHGDASAAVLVDGVVLAAVEEERLTRVKHESGLPVAAVASVLELAGLAPTDIEHIAISRDPRAHRARRTARGLLQVVRTRQLPSRSLAAHRRVLSIGEDLTSGAGTAPSAIVHHVEHHDSHLASAYFATDYEDAAVCSVDGMGDNVSMAWGSARGNDVSIDGRVWFPDSIGFFYTSITQLLGFPHYGDEYKVMGLAPYGTPRYLPEMRVVLRDHGDSFRLAPACFRPGRLPFTWRFDGGPPVLGDLFTPALEDVLGPRRHPTEPIDDRHRDLAASAQARLEEVLVPMLDRLQRRTGSRRLAMAGGVALNVTANTRILAETAFDDVYVQPAASDAGTSVGAALHVAHRVLGREDRHPMEHVYLGPGYDRTRCTTAAEAAQLDYRCLEEDELCDETARLLSEGRIVGWFQGRMEFGPRALGNRSIVCDPRSADMKDTLNLRTKRRESFRPFAPSVLVERAADLYELDGPSPYMLFAPRLREAWQGRLPAVTHVDGTGRVQTVDARTNLRYWKLLRAFEARTGVPVLLNTSFNENEPIVCTPEEAIACFLRADMDVLVLGDLLIEAA